MEPTDQSQPIYADSLQGPQEALALQRVLIETAADAYYVWEPAEDRYTFSPQFGAILGMRVDELPRNDDGITALYHPDDLERVFESWRSVWPDGDQWRAEYRLRRADGTYAVLDERASILHDEAGRAVRLVGMVRDVTMERQAVDALRASRDLYEALFREAHDPALRVGPTGVIEDANAPALEWFGLATGDLGNATLRALLSPEVFDEFARSMAERQVMKHLEIAVPGDPGERYLLASVTHCRTNEGDFAFLLGTDITESRRLHDELQASRAELQAQATTLEDTNTALRVIMEQRDRDSRELAARMASNMEELVLPMLEGVRRSLGPGPQAIRLDGLRETIENVTADLVPSDASGRRGHPDFTRRENEIAAMIRAGKTTSEIAEALFLTPATITSHRRNMRRKLGLAGPSSRLAAALRS